MLVRSAGGRAHRPAVGREVADVEEVRRAQGPHGIGQVAFAGAGDVPLAAGDDPVALGIDLAALVGLQQRQQRLAIEAGGRRDAADFHERRREVGQADEVVDDAAAFAAGHAHRERDADAVVVEVALAGGHARHAVVAADDDERVVELAGLFEPLQQHADLGIDGLALAEVVGHVLADFGHVGQEFGQLAGQRIGLDAPQLLAGAFDPDAMRRRRAEPIEPRLAGLAVGEEGVEVAADLVENLCLGFVNAAPPSISFVASSEKLFGRRPAFS